MLRAGRAGSKGTAYTFICEEEERYAPDLVKALQESGAAVPRDLLELAEGFTAKRKRGEAQAHGSGYGGSGFKFDNQEEEARNAERKVCLPAFFLELLLAGVLETRKAEIICGFSQAAAREARRAQGDMDSDDEADERLAAITDGAIREAQPQITFAENVSPSLRHELGSYKTRCH